MTNVRLHFISDLTSLAAAVTPPHRHCIISTQQHFVLLVDYLPPHNSISDSYSGAGICRSGRSFDMILVPRSTRLMLFLWFRLFILFFISYSCSFHECNWGKVMGFGGSFFSTSILAHREKLVAVLKVLGTGHSFWGLRYDGA